jgi:imidazolonepropionase-like amidohydrolase
MRCWSKSVLTMLLLGTTVIIAAFANAKAQQHLPSQSGLMPTALVGGTLLDGFGGPPVRNSVVLIREERIERVGTVGSLSVPAGYERISTEGMTVLPGLWDPHVHLAYGGHPSAQVWFQKYAAQFESVTIPASAEQFLMAGVTTVRDLAAPLDAIIAVKQRIERGELPGATIFASGPALAKSAANANGPTSPLIASVTSEADARAKVKQYLDAGVHIIKVVNGANWTLQELRSVVADAHARGVKVTSHARGDEELRRNLEAGVDEMQHIGVDGTELPMDLVTLIRERVRTGPTLYWCPTVGITMNADYVATTPEYLNDPANFRGFPPAMADDIRKAISERRQEGPRRRTSGGDPVSVTLRKFNQLKALGVEFVFGSDEGTFGSTASQGTSMEAEAWVHQLGFDPMTVIKKMTSEPARLMGVDRDFGTVSEGKFADVIAVRGDPLRDINVLRDPSLIVKHGRRYK